MDDARRSADEAAPALTRRQLRAAAERARAEQERAERDQPEPEPEQGHQVSRVSARRSLPAHLPPEPEVDDVRWEGARWPGAPVAPTSPGSPAASSAPSAPSPPSSPTPRPPFPPVRAATDGPTGEIPAVRAGSDAEADDLAPSEPQATVPDPGSWGAVPAADGGPSAPADLPTLTDLLATRGEPADGPAEIGWRATVRRATGGLLTLGPGPAERRHRDAVARVQRPIDGPRTIMVLNPKGGAHKTTAALLLASTLGQHRGGYTLAWDNNETRGTLGWRSHHGTHHRTAVDLLADLDRFVDPGSSRVGDLDGYVRSQPGGHFDVLASDEDAASAASIDAAAFRSLHRTLSRFYRLLVVDTGNNMRASNWQAALDVADQVVIVSTVREDTAQSAAWAVDALRATGHEDLVRRAVTVLSAPAVRRDAELADRLHDHFGRLTRTVLDVPYDPSLVAGGPLDLDALSAESREAWLAVTAAVADGL